MPRRSTLTSALSGDQTAMGLLNEYASTFLEASRNLYASGDAYNVDFERVMQALFRKLEMQFSFSLGTS